MGINASRQRVGGNIAIIVELEAIIALPHAPAFVKNIAKAGGRLVVPVNQNSILSVKGTDRTLQSVILQDAWTGSM